VPNIYYQTRFAKDLVSALNICLELRQKDFWSFRGQRNASWKLGLHGAGSVDELDDYLQQLRRRCMEFPPPHYIEESNQWRWLFFAQHHRLKTRLLDWTKDPLVAIYFAVEDIISGATDMALAGAIWALHVAPLHFKNADELRPPTEIEEWIMVNPPPVTPRLARQSGLFTYHPGPDCRTPLDAMTRRPGGERLVKILIRSDSAGNTAEHIRQQLGILNIHHGSLFPDPEGIAQFVNHEWPIIADPKHLQLRSAMISSLTRPINKHVKQKRVTKEATRRKEASRRSPRR
jgi:hypothetical protein